MSKSRRLSVLKVAKKLTTTRYSLNIKSLTIADTHTHAERQLGPARRLTHTQRHSCTRLHMCMYKGDFS